MDDVIDSKYDHWIKELQAEEKAHKEFRKQAKKVEERYFAEEKGADSKFNILWSNTETMQAAVYAKSPVPDVRRRFKDQDPVGRSVAEVIERALSFCIDTYSFDDESLAAIKGYLVPGLGQIRLRYIPYFQKGEPPKIPLYEEEREDDDGPYTVYMDAEGAEVDDVEFDDEGPYMLGEAEDELVYEEVIEESVPYSRFRWQPVDRWQNVMWCAIDHYLTKDEVKDQFGEDIATAVPYGFSDEGERISEEEDGKTRALFHEVFDKADRKVYVICPGYNKVIEEVDDPLELEGFYPFPKPLMATTKAGKLTPKPDYLFYQDQALELDRLTQRIDKLTEELKYRGVYDGSFKNLANIATLDDGEFEPVDDFAERFEGKGNLDSVVKTMPLEELQRVIAALYQAREQVKQTIYEVTGIADIIRGATKATETLGAQKIKGQFATMRIDNRRNAVAAFLRDVLRIKAEIICEHFSAETLSLMTGVDVTPEMMEVMQSDALRAFKVDIETDSTVALDAEAEQKNRIELLTTITGFLQQAGPMVAQGMLPPEVAQELILFGIRAFKGGRQLEEVLEQMSQQPAQALPQPGPQGMPPNVVPLPQGNMNGVG